MLEFFRQVYRLLVPGGIFVLEPQEWEGYKKAKRVDRVSRHLWLFQTSVAKWSQKLAENARRLKLRPEMFEEELAKIGLTLEEAYGTPGEGGMYPTHYIQVHLTLTAKQALNALCMLIANRHERCRLMHNQVPSDRNRGSTVFEKGDNHRLGSKFSLIRNFQVYDTYAALIFSPSSCDFLFLVEPSELSLLTMTGKRQVSPPRLQQSDMNKPT